MIDKQIVTNFTCSRPYFGAFEKG